MDKEYAIIMWINDLGPFPRLTKENTIKIYTDLEEADEAANLFEEDNINIKCRVINIDSVHE